MTIVRRQDPVVPDGGLRFRTRFVWLALLPSTLAPGCVSTRIATPSVALAPLPPSAGATKRQQLEQLVDAFDAHEVVFPESALLRGIGPGLVTLGGQANEIGQTAGDQLTDKSGGLAPHGVRVLDGDGLFRATQTRAFTERSAAHCRADRGNVPSPMFEPAWIPLPVRPDLDDAQLAPTVACPVRDAPSPGGRSGHFCMYAELALQPEERGRPPAPLIFVVPGLLHSADHQYVRDTAAVLFSRGYSVALVDMRDHGGTFHGQWWLPSTLGVLEGHDLVGAARYVAHIRPPGPTAITRFGVVGYSAGGLFALRGAIQDRGRLFSEGVLAISPILDLGETLTRMGKVGSCCAFDLACISQRAMAYYFMDLLKTRMLGLELEAGKKDVTAITPADYARERILPFPAYAGLPDARDLVTPERLADDLRAAAPAQSAPPSVAVLTSHDDPVVGDRAAMTVRSRLAGDPAVGVYVPRRGGHIAFSVLSPAVTRAFLRGFFDGVPCPPGA